MNTAPSTSSSSSHHRTSAAAPSMLSLFDSKRKRRLEKRNARRWTVVELKLEPPTANSYPDFDWEEIKRACKIEDSDSEDEGIQRDQDAEELVKRIEAKYARAGEKRKWRYDPRDVMDKGMGYDKEDPFIDDTEAYDEWVPSWLDTALGGHYVNRGVLQWKRLDGEEDDGGDDGPKRRRGKKPKVKGPSDKPKEKKERKTTNNSANKEKKEKKPRKESTKATKAAESKGGEGAAEEKGAGEKVVGKKELAAAKLKKPSKKGAPAAMASASNSCKSEPKEKKEKKVKTAAAGLSKTPKSRKSATQPQQQPCSSEGAGQGALVPASFHPSNQPPKQQRSGKEVEPIIEVIELNSPASSLPQPPTAATQTKADENKEKCLDKDNLAQPLLGAEVPSYKKSDVGCVGGEGGFTTTTSMSRPAVSIPQPTLPQHSAGENAKNQTPKRVKQRRKRAEGMTPKEGEQLAMEKPSGNPSASSSTESVQLLDLMIKLSPDSTGEGGWAKSGEIEVKKRRLAGGTKVPTKIAGSTPSSAPGAKPPPKAQRLSDRGAPPTKKPTQLLARTPSNVWSGSSTASAQQQQQEQQRLAAPLPSSNSTPNADGGGGGNLVE